jgi:FtsH-binding integral membrane protein
MKSQTRLRLTGTFTLLGFAVLVTQAMAWMLSTVANFAYGSVPLFWFAAFGALTVPFVIIWIRKDAARSYEIATMQGFLGLEGEPPHVISIANDCPKRWWVSLHIRLHPELIGVDDS